MQHAILVSGPDATPHARPVDLTCRQSRWLGRVIAGLRDGTINDVAVRHLEVDGVLQLDPLVELAASHAVAI